MRRQNIPQLSHEITAALPEETVSERALYTAMIMRAVEDLSDYTTLPKIDRYDNRNNPYTWIFDDPDDLRPLSFSWTCSQLDLDPEVVRERIRANFKISPYWLKH